MFNFINRIKNDFVIKSSHSFSFLFVVCLNSLNLISQEVVSIDYIMKTEINEVKEYEATNSKSNLLYIPFNFSSNKALTTALYDSLSSSSRIIEKIDFVYTRFKLSHNFDQEKLNRERLETLRKYALYIFDNNLIEWSFYEQVNDMTLEENRKLFHGFVIHYLDESVYSGNNGNLNTEEEITTIKKYLTRVEPATTDSVIETILEGESRYSPLLKRKKEKGIYFSKKFLGIWRKELPATFDTTWTTVYHSSTYSPFGNDSVVIQTLRRYEDQWNCNYLIEDVTGSMYPYIAQTLAWKKLKMDSSVLEHFIFFNDGDHKPDGPIGHSGGAYYLQSHDFNEIGEKIYSVMRKGGGGGTPENNIEALLTAEKSFSESNSYILIADNNAPIRDMIISEKIEKPIHIILCGVRNGAIHHSYIKLAMTTGGSLHTIEEDVNHIKEMKPGDTFILGRQKWKYLERGIIILVK